MPQIIKHADVPKVRPGYDSIGISAPIMMQMDSNGKWESAKPESFDEEQLENVVKYLMKSNAVNVVQSYCSQCAADNKNSIEGGKSTYVPVIMMPVYSGDGCPELKKSEVHKLNQPKVTKKRKLITDHSKESEKKGLKKRVFQLQRLTDFDLLSQW